MIVFVVGTGTDVGKTHVTCALLAEARRQGLRVSAYKPVITGIPGASSSPSSPPVEESDVDRHVRYLGALTPAPAYVFPEPVSPHLAARIAGVTLDADELAEAATEHARPHEVLFVESAGGLFSPLGDTTTSADLALALRARGPVRTLLVAADRLGVLHDVRATCLSSAHVGCALDLVVLSAPAVPDASTRRNAPEIEQLGIATVTAVFPRALPDAPGSSEAAQQVLRALGLLPAL